VTGEQLDAALADLLLGMVEPASRPAAPPAAGAARAARVGGGRGASLTEGRHR